MIRAFPTCGPVRYHHASFPTHRAFDIFGREGAPVYAVEAGTIFKRNTALDLLGGYLVGLRAESGRLYWMTHLQEPGRYPAGTRVRAGQRIGRLGQTGNAPSPHIHFQAVSPQGRALDVYDELKAVERSTATQTAAGGHVGCPTSPLVWAAVLGAGYLAWRYRKRLRRIVRA